MATSSSPPAARDTTPKPGPIVDADGSPLCLADVLTEEFEKVHGRKAPQGESDPQRLAALFGEIHRLPGRAALCLSGGGIRSATFGLGVLQTLARLDLLDRFDYLSTVSGGGYIGGWLSAWVKHDGLERVVWGLRQDPRAAGRPTPEPEAVRHLRAYSNYLNPRAGLLSIDTWALAVTFVRNLLLNWLVLLPTLAFIALVPHVLTRLLDWSAGYAWAPSAALVGIGLGLVGVTYGVIDLPRAGVKESPVDNFKLGYLLPMTGACVAFAFAARWYGDSCQNLSFWHLCPGGAVIHIGSGALAYIFYKTLPSPAKREGVAERLRWNVWRALAALASGGVAGAMVWLGPRWVFPALQRAAVAYPSSPPGLHAARTYLLLAPPWFVVSFLIATALHAAFTGKYSSEDDREWWSRASAWLAVVTLGWLAVVGVSLYSRAALPVATDRWLGVGRVGSVGGLAGVVTALVGYVSKTGLGRLDELRDLGPIRRFVERYGLNASAGIFALALAMVVATGIDDLESAVSTNAAAWPWLPPAFQGEVAPSLTLLAAFALATAVFAGLIGVNRFSLHAMYGNRLIRAYLGASRRRTPHRLTGFDSDDNFAFCALNRESGPQKPFHVVNITLNLVRGDNLAWQTRKAMSFTVSCLHAGSWNGLTFDPQGTKAGCYRRSSDYAEGAPKAPISLGKAITISGAAASPNMGYHSSRLVGLVMTLFNARLGWWLGNPRYATSRLAEPIFALRPFIDEALGLTHDQGPYIYLSDGGHFENLGLYEMVLRRCRTIVVVDASCDPALAFVDLSRAMYLIRADLGISITLGDPPSAERPWYEADIHYGDVDEGALDGKLIVLKPMLSPDAPLDVRAYAATTDAKAPFPHQTSADQFFDEAQFESYRELGAHITHLAKQALEDAFRPPPPATPVAPPAPEPPGGPLDEPGLSPGGPPDDSG
jgi:patatin-like phospholipase